MAAEDRSGMSIGLTYKEMRESVRFYHDQLGFVMKESWPSEDEPQWANMLLGGQSIISALR